MLFSLIFLLTSNTLLAIAMPFLHAGWPAARTAFWLLRSDPWRARAWAMFFFELGMAGLLASCCGFVMMTTGLMLESLFQQAPNIDEMIPAMLAMLIGLLVSFAMGWIGTFIAWWYGVKVFVSFDLHRRCNGDFSRITELTPQSFGGMNSGNFILAIAIGLPSIIVWCALLVWAIPAIVPAGFEKVAPFIFVSVVVGSIVAKVIYLSNKVIARSPYECWGVVPPKSAERADTWYQTE
jgi:hypothetical protein